MIKLIKYFSVFILISGNLFAQSSSSYSRIGLGNLEYSNSARNIGMGGLGVSISDPDFLNTINPASWNKLRRTRIETGFNYSGIFLSDVNQSSYVGDGDFSGFTFGFPVSSLYGIGVVAGMIPYSNISYKVAQNIPATSSVSSEYKIFYEGKGGLSKLFIGTSFRLPFDLSLGATFDYYFGNLDYVSKVEFINSQGVEAEYQRTYSPSGFGTVLGLITPDMSGIFNSQNISDFRFGVTLNYISELTTDTLLASVINFDTDTVGVGEININVPLRISTGISFILANKYLLSFDYIYQPWSEYKFNNIQSANLRDAMKISGGFEYRPLREPGSTFWEQIILRSGLSWEQTQYVINGNGVDQFSLHAGFSFPISFENTFDIGLEYAIRGSADPDLIKENLFRVSVGVSLGDLWFIRQEK